MIPLGLFGFALATAYCPFITGAAASPRWAVLALGASGVLWLRLVRSSSAYWVGAAFVAWALASIAWSPAFEAFDQAWKLLLLALLFLLGASLRDLRPFYAGCALGVGLSSALVIADLAGWVRYIQWSRPSGLFVNYLYLAEFAALVTVALLASGMWRWAILCLPALVPGAFPRGPLLALAVAGIVWLWREDRRFAAWMGAALALGMPLLASFRPDSVFERLRGWADIVNHLTWIGHGLGAYFDDAPWFEGDTGTRRLHANNDLLETAYDLGVIGAALVLAFFAALLNRRGSMVEKFVLVVFAVEAAFGFPFYLPWSAGFVALAAGHLAGHRPDGVRVPAIGRNEICAGDGGALGGR